MKLIITEKDIEIQGFDDVKFQQDHMGSCRDVGRVALIWGLKKLTRELEKDLTGDWESQTSFIGSEVKMADEENELLNPDLLEAE